MRELKESDMSNNAVVFLVILDLVLIFLFYRINTDKLPSYDEVRYSHGIRFNARKAAESDRGTANIVLCIFIFGVTAGLCGVLK
jgi:hypothetical protein